MKKVFVFVFIVLFSGVSHVQAAGGGSYSSNDGDGDGGGYAAVQKNPELKPARQAISRQDFTTAISEIRSVLEEQPDNADAWNLLGYSSRKTGDFKTAEAAYTKALDLDPKHTQAMEYMGEMYLTLNQPDKAEELLARLNKLCSFNCNDRDDLEAAIKSYKAARS